MAEAKRSLRPDVIQRECEASLRRLGLERIDLYQFHWADESGVAVEDSWAAMAKLVERGKIRAAAGFRGHVGARSPEQVDGRIAASGVELDAAELDEIAGAVERTGAGSGPVRPPTR